VKEAVAENSVAVAPHPALYLENNEKPGAVKILALINHRRLPAKPTREPQKLKRKARIVDDLSTNMVSYI
jgi:hypothetical protein